MMNSWLLTAMILSLSSVTGLATDTLNREFPVAHKYLNLPVQNGAPKTVLNLTVEGEKVRQFDIELAPGEPDFWVFLDISEFSGKTVRLETDNLDSLQKPGFESIHQADSYPGEDQTYREKHRPQFHFTSKRGWNNDPNGMVYYDGEYHLFYQHNPFGWRWGNMTWGHAVSRDLIHWEELGDAIHPDNLGTIFSGSAVVDEINTTGFQSGDEKTIIAAYTSAGGNNPWSEGQPFTQSIAYSNDRGRTWTKYDGNPVQKHLAGSNRDPKVIWHEPTEKWVIALYLDKSTLAFFNSDDLKTWEKTSELESFYECPELFEMALDGDKSKKKWILYGASGDYYVGEFDGKEFQPDTEIVKFHFGNCFYASQTFSDIPEEDGRRIQIGWGRGDIPGMPFNQMMNFPSVLTLHSTEEGPRVHVHPVEEITDLRKCSTHLNNLELNDEIKVLEGIEGNLLDIDLKIEVDEAKEVGIKIGSNEVVYDTSDSSLQFKDQQAPLKAVDGEIQLRLLVDRTSVEIFANQGRVYIPVHHIPEDGDYSVSLFTRGGEAEFESVDIHELNSIWE